MRVALKGRDALTSSIVRCQSCSYGGCEQRAPRDVANRLDEEDRWRYRGRLRLLRARRAA
jgi:hypothetical protein